MTKDDMKAIVFDSGPLITFALNSILEIITFLKNKYEGQFYVTNDVMKEIIDNPAKSKRFGFESLLMKGLIYRHVIESFDTTVYEQEKNVIADLSNSIFSIKGKNLNIFNAGELDSLVLAKNINADAVVVDERTTRLMIENPYRLHKMLRKKFKANVEIDKKKLKEFEQHFSMIKIIRSVDLALVAFDYGFFDGFTHYDSKEQVVNSLLWAMKLNGCAISEREIAAFTKLYKK